MTGRLFHYLAMAQSLHNGAHARATVSMPVTLVLERSGQQLHGEFWVCERDKEIMLQVSLTLFSFPPLTLSVALRAGEGKLRFHSSLEFWSHGFPLGEIGKLVSKLGALSLVLQDISNMTRIKEMMKSVENNQPIQS